MKNIFLIFFTALLLASVGCSKHNDEKVSQDKSENTAETNSVKNEPVIEIVEKTEDKAVSGKSGVLIHIMEGQEPYKFLLALDMAEKMSAEYEVMVYFDHLAVNAVLKDSKDVKYSPFTPMRAQMAKLQTLGVKMRACSPCLQASWKKPEDMSAGVSMFDSAELATLGGGNVITFSY